MNINWNEAPKGTTHYDTTSEVPHYVSYFNDTWYLWANSSWVLLSKMYYEDDIFRDKLITREDVDIDELIEVFQPYRSLETALERYTSKVGADVTPKEEECWCFTIADDPIRVHCRGIHKLTSRLVYFDIIEEYKQHIYKREDICFIEESF